MKRCDWVDLSSPLYVEYHDKEWGVPVHNDRKLYEMLMLEGAQAGLSWSTILKKRENYRKAFDNFDFNRIADYKKNKIDSLLENSGIIRNRLKIGSAVRNAAVFLKIINESGSFDGYIWSFVNNQTIQNSFHSLREIPARTELSDKISVDLKKKGMNFVGSTIIYAFLQAVGIVNDHLNDCYRYKELKNPRPR
jgi:DNA-3-methyladenine glycosylase I